MVLNKAIIPAANSPKRKMGKVEIFPVRKLSQAIEALQSM